MNTVVANWKIVSVIDGEGLVGKVLWGTCVYDNTCRFVSGDYICTSQINEINSNTCLIKTASGSVYQILGEGSNAEVQFKDFELLRNGFSPEQITQLNLAPNGIFH
jgi:hypothetical protein